LYRQPDVFVAFEALVFASRDAHKVACCFANGIDRLAQRVLPRLAGQVLFDIRGYILAGLKPVFFPKNGELAVDVEQSHGSGVAVVVFPRRLPEHESVVGLHKARQRAVIGSLLDEPCGSLFGLDQMLGRSRVLVALDAAGHPTVDVIVGQKASHNDRKVLKCLGL
jgi:hypothetical protein